MRIILCVILIALLTACSNDNPKRLVRDQCLRTQLFKECMSELPAGPVSTHYNDWDEVISTCDSTASFQSMRPAFSVKPECLSEY